MLKKLKFCFRRERESGGPRNCSDLKKSDAHYKKSLRSAAIDNIISPPIVTDSATIRFGFLRMTNETYFVIVLHSSTIRSGRIFFGVSILRINLVQKYELFYDESYKYYCSNAMKER